MADCTGNQWVKIFEGEAAQSIFSYNSEKLGEMYENDQKAYNKVFYDASFKRYTLKLRAKPDFYNGAQKVGHTLMSAVPIGKTCIYSKHTVMAQEW